MIYLIPVDAVINISMIADIHYTASVNLLQEAVAQLPNFDDRLDLNQQTGNFFYDKWKLLPEFEGSVWHQILDTLPLDIGQARIMKLKPGCAYYSHADVDDRYHINLCGSKSYLIDLDTNQMYPTVLDGKWYEMNAGKRHSAVNFGNTVRIQLVVRKLIQRNILADSTAITISAENNKHDYRYVFDDVFSPWLNNFIKKGQVCNFSVKEDQVSFSIEKSLLVDLQHICPEGFKIVICQ